jgi:hypothetical protein
MEARTLAKIQVPHLFLCANYRLTKYNAYAYVACKVLGTNYLKTLLEVADPR